MVLRCFKSSTISTSTLQKEAKEEAGVARGDGVAVRQEDVVHHEAEAAEEDLEVIVAEEALEVIVVAEALGAAEAQEGSAVVVAVAEAEVEDSGDLEEVVVDSEGHDAVFMYVKHNLEIVEVAISHSGSSGLQGLGSHGKAIPGKNRIITKHSFLSVDRVMVQTEDKCASFGSYWTV